MDVHVIDEEEGMGHRVMAYDGDAETNEGGELNNAENSSAHDDDGAAEPHVGMQFDTEDAAKTFYDEYARRLGFSSKPGNLSRSRADGTIVAQEFVCAREGFLKRRSADSCEAKLRIELRGQDKWTVTKFIKEHSHTMVSPSKVHYLRPRRHFAGAAKGITEPFQGGGTVPSGVMYVSMDGNRVSAEGNRGLRNASAADSNRVIKNATTFSFSVRPNTRKRILGRDFFTVTNVLTLPAHYILRRWTRNSKNGPGIDERGGEVNGQESLILRYNNLCREAIKYAEEGATAVDTYNVALGALREGGKKVAAVKKNVAKVPPPSSQVGGIGYDDRKTSTSASDTTPLLWPRQDEVIRRFNLNDAGAAAQSVADLNLPRMAPVSLQRDDGPPGNMAVLPCLKSMTWVMENKNLTPGNRVAVINLKLQDYSKTPSTESEVKFQLSRVTLEPMLRSMAYISEQLSTPANRVAVINLKLQDTETTSGESEVKFQVSRDTLGAMLRSMAYIREQLSNAAEPQPEPQTKKQRK
ncbi:hypothetical protein RCOM_1110800 [Ricinus communis]|uniref:FAR1 domain-containing protein n=1 Tax=Ricinus communis TaxID=3988 RepID=B9S6M5_RICCO|nr:hypothetical protein RCOM_1110800 [Ricinus communis]